MFAKLKFSFDEVRGPSVLAAIRNAWSYGAWDARTLVPRFVSLEKTPDGKAPTEANLQFFLCLQDDRGVSQFVQRLLPLSSTALGDN